ncbi:PPOX class F420-dependent oxidoreductase [Rhodococcus sp. BP-252]|uniref:PPOX class F420-dependent enzyme n=1 Tax=Rhodococcoides kyotonense TaxID=398843 RepID=A0A177Y8P9_9NOCA|nr:MULTISPECIES: PPOX class F420-dependent oxidoreductase [Rhodococcus]MBY6411890.1 PPOX class F420-dependent oxidoreductase [Rhodococcus sp. BP-320]MBY6416482.1 PPOX class F420-dependent oxidoreductase [Rhodococcus sp. BP-321]MBY6420712.1 PPOX class F420-dependent oxidoreductase [Rhodococcus sp. BP-324]MBY6426506.1 PPOX class F420-dependent oxidoreductase [Rhodococcus sp. BP-323]MBY6431505.1 PPOX class F420-dependent oxidoreductase [Rhodococcus sp. BP-322]
MPKPPLPADAVELLKKPNPAVMAVVRADGTPITAPTWYLWEDDKIVLNFQADRKRLEHIKANPKVSISVLDEASWYTHVTVHGTITLQDDPNLVDIDRISTHYTGEPYPVRDQARVTGYLEVDAYVGWGKVSS